MSYTLGRFSYLSISIDEFQEHHLKGLREILENIGASVTRVFINAMGKRVMFYQSALVSWLNLMPNLAHVSSGGLFSCTEVQDDPNSTLQLANLQSIRLCPMGLGLKLHQTPASSVQLLQLNDQVPLPNINAIFEKHSQSLKHLDLFRPVYTDPLPFRHLELFNLSCLYQSYMNNPEHDRFLIDVISHQQSLEILTLGECDLLSNCYPVSSQLLRVICSKRDLQELSFGLSFDVSPLDVMEMRALTDLAELTIQMYFEDFSVESDEIIEALCSTRLPELQSLRLLSSLGNLPLDLLLDSFENLSSLELSELSFTFQPGRVYANLLDLSLYSEFHEPIDVRPSLIKSLTNLDILKVSHMFPRVSTFRAILKSKISSIEISVAVREDLSQHKLKKIKKLCKKLAEKCFDCDIDFQEDSSLLIV